MFKPTYLILIIIFSNTIFLFAQNINISNYNFRKALLEHSPIIDTNRDKIIQLEEATDFNGTLQLQDKNIKDLQGIEYFKNITAIDCSSNRLKVLDLSSNTKLKYINCQNNKLTELNLPKDNYLKQLYCSNNHIKEIDLEYTGIQYLQCQNAPYLRTIMIPNHADIMNWDIENGVTIFRYYE